MSDPDVEVRRILAAKNLYAVLGVSPSAPEDEIRRAYKKLALLTHPDKNQRPGAEDAFKAVGKAFSTLSDAQKRSTYDRYGEEGLQNEGRSNGRYETSPDDIYDLFAQMFGADLQGMRTQHRQRYTEDPRFRRTQQRAPNQQQEHNPAAQLFTLVPILLFFLVYFLFSFGSFEANSPQFSLVYDQSSNFIRKRVTKDHNVPYYVQPNFVRDVASDKRVLRETENQVYHSYRNYMSRRCQFEQKEKAQMKERAATYYTGKKRSEMIDAANNAETPSCDTLHDLVQRYGK